MVLRTGSTMLLLAAACIASTGSLAGQVADDGEAAFRELYRELVEINTTRSVGSCTRAAEAMRARLLAAGIPEADTRILAPADRPDDGALIALLPGRDPSLKPLLLLAHIDVVEARREDWERDPFKLVEEDGFFYARGASDDKAMAASLTDSVIRFKEGGFVPRRGIKLALTCGEETPEIFNSVKWLTQERPDVLDAAFALNEGAGGELGEQGRHIALNVQAGEKVYQDFTLSITDSGGHSSIPKKNNPIVEMSAALVRLGAYRFPVAFNDATRLRGNYRACAAGRGRGHAGGPRKPFGRGGHRAPLGRQAGVEQHAAHDLHGDDGRGWACAQCAGAARIGQRQLPHPAGRAGGGGAADDPAGAGRWGDPGRTEG